MLILGGTFDPPHIGHLVLGEHARVELGEPAVTLVPAGDPWRKSVPAAAERRPEPSPARHRLAMTRLAVREANRGSVGGGETVTVDDREVRRAGPSYTVDTLSELRADGHGAVTLLLGSDALADLPHWHEPERILALARIAVAPKPGETALDEAIQTVEAAIPGAAAGVLVLRTIPPLQVSSTQVRERVRAGLSARFLVAPAVERYVMRHGLYRD